MFKLTRISSGHRVGPPKRHIIVAKSVKESFLLLQLIQVLLFVSRFGFCGYKMWYRLKLQRAAFDDDVQSLVQTMVTKQSHLFISIQVAVLLSYIITATVFVYYIVQETHLPIPMAILGVDLCFQFGHSILICLWLVVEIIGVCSFISKHKHSVISHKSGQTLGLPYGT